MSSSNNNTLQASYYKAMLRQLPVIREGIFTFQLDSTAVGIIERSQQAVQVIMNTANQMGISNLAHIAQRLDEGLTDAMMSRIMLTRHNTAILLHALETIERYLNHLQDRTPFNEAQLRLEVDMRFEQLQIEEIFVVPDEEEFGYLDDDLIDAFRMEAEEHFQIIQGVLSQVQKEPAALDALQDMRRSIHTLKGTSGLMGFTDITKLAHRVEDLLAVIADRGNPIDEVTLDLFYQVTETMDDMVNQRLKIADKEEILNGLYTCFDMLIKQPVADIDTDTDAEPADALTAEPQPTAVIETGQLSTDLSAPMPTIQTVLHDTGELSNNKQPDGRRTSAEVIRVPLERMDELVRLTSELVVSHNSLNQQVDKMTQVVNEIQPNVGRINQLSKQLETQYEIGQSNTPQPADDNQYGFDALEFDSYNEFHILSRAMSETGNDLRTISQEFHNLFSTFNQMMKQQEGLASQLQQNLLKVRMLPLSTLSSRLQRTIRSIARQQEKQIELIIEGEEVEIDKTVLEEVADPLLHLVRNAIDHGIEPAAERQAAGKAVMAKIRLRAYYDGNQVVIEVHDDGRGIDPQKIYAQAQRKQFVEEAVLNEMSEAELFSLLFQPGFSTASKITEISGRGVGLDVVEQNVRKLNGRVTVQSTIGSGTIFTLRLPITLAVTRVLMIKAHNEQFAVPYDPINDLFHNVPRPSINAHGEAKIELNGQMYPALALSEILNLPQQLDHETRQEVAVLLLTVRGKQVALIADEIMDVQEVVVKTLGSHLRYVKGIAGATFLPSGQIVLILNPADLLEIPNAAQRYTRILTPAAPEPSTRVLVVDDSVSIRRVTAKLIQKAGWEAFTARDGVAALEVLAELDGPADIILLDVEMPRMDGYEFAHTLRQQKQYEATPIIMITSRAGEKHRQKAAEAGVNAYLVKPFQENELLALIRDLTQ